ncbi:hypothetical protein BH10PSE11_BH10PSE11_31470 [soil metagenome]
MPKKSSSTPVKKPAVKKAARKMVARKAVRKVAVRTTAAKKPVAAEPKTAKRPRAKVLNEHPDHLVVDAHDHVALEAIESAAAKASHARPRRRTAVDIAADPPQGEAGAASMVARVSDAIERELSKIERIVGNPTRMQPSQRVETESRARVLASLARTLKEVMRLREQERGDDKAKAADDDAIPRDLDEFRRELSRRLEGLVAGATPISDRGDEPR